MTDINGMSDARKALMRVVAKEQGYTTPPELLFKLIPACKDAMENVPGAEHREVCQEIIAESKAVNVGYGKPGEDD